MIPTIPAGYTAQLLATATDISGAGLFYPAEESQAEYTRMVLCIDCGSVADAESAAQTIQEGCLAQGVLYWPEYPGQYTFVDGSSVYVAWVKGFAWMAIIAGLILVPVIGMILWALMPESLQQLISAVIMMFVMMIMMRMMMPMLKGPEEKK
jgi:hypothetical protein